MTNDLVKLRRSRARLLLDYVISANDCVLEMIASVDTMIDNADVYEGGDASTIFRYTQSDQGRSYVRAYQDIGFVVEAAVKCIDIIDKRVMPK